MKQKLIDAVIPVIALGIGLIATMANVILSSNGIG
ncbi:Phage protein [Escherichia phage rV5_ev158]|nr:Phage protein [Escherichia phage rV5_ev168]VVA60516.1 Phage protein [Escherichia phage rV5_ev158]